MFASEVRRSVEVSGHTIVIRKLSARSLDKARQARSAVAAKGLREMGGEIFRALRSENVDGLVAELEERRRDPETVKSQRYAAYDRDTVLQAGLVSWSHSRDLTPESIGDLDEETAESLHEAILDLSLPPLDPAEIGLAEEKD